MKQMKTYTKSDFHNPEQLTRQQVGVEYRLLLVTESQEDSEAMIRGSGTWVDVGMSECPRWSHRVPLATPLPDGTVLSSNECCFSDDVYAELRAAHAAGKKIEWRPTNTSSWRDDEADVPAWEGYGFEFRVKPEPEKPRLYLAGGMTGYVDYNFPAFFKAAAKLEKQGYEVLNPAQMDLDSGWTLEELKELDVGQFQEFLKGAVKRDLDAIQTCQAIAMLPGWESSKGAKAELAVAQWLGLDEVYLEDAKQPYNSNERAEWNNDCGKIDMGDYCISKEEAEKHTIKFAPDDPKGAAGAKKAPMWLLPASAMRETAWVHKHGADKYGPFNWREGSVCSSTYISAIMRHLDLWRDGEDNDAESGRSHLASIAASCNILMDAMQCGTLRDDRNKLK